MLSEVRYQVFLSSTYEDLRLERQQATQAILEMGHMPAGMELFPASDLSQWELIKTVINESDYYVLIIGGRYGSVHEQTGLSFTEMEYDYASSIEIPILGFVRKDISQIPVRDSEQDSSKRQQLGRFRDKVMNRICRQYDEASDLGMLVMKSLMSETRTNPRIGWVRGNQARGEEDIAREKALIDDLSKQERRIKKLERKIRDLSVPLSDIDPEQISQGEDAYGLTVMFQDKNKRHVANNVDLSWDEIFSVIGPHMYGYILRRGSPAYNQVVGSYSFEGSLVEYVRTKIIHQVGTRQIKLLPHQIDTILIQFKQLGLMQFQEKTEDEDGKDFRGYTLTEAGEAHLTRVKVQVR